MRWKLECYECHGDGVTYSCFEEFACVDPESGCDDCERRCDICEGKGFYFVTELTEDNCEDAIPVCDDDEAFEEMNRKLP